MRRPAGAVGMVDCVILTERPATVTVAVRDVEPLYGSTLNRTVPLLVPLASALSESQLTFSAAVHAQPAGALTFTDTVPPALATECVAGATE